MVNDGVAMHGSVMCGSTRVAYHCAAVHGVDTVFATVEYPLSEPPELVEICGTTWERPQGKGSVTHDN